MGGPPVGKQAMPWDQQRMTGMPRGGMGRGGPAGGRYPPGGMDMSVPPPIDLPVSCKKYWTHMKIAHEHSSVDSKTSIILWKSRFSTWLFELLGVNWVRVREFQVLQENTVFLFQDIWSQIFESNF